MIDAGFGCRYLRNKNNKPHLARGTGLAMKSILQVALVWSALTSVGFTQSRCDCDEIVGQCTAQITELPTNSPGARFRITANTERCSIVEWSVDGDRGMTTVWDDGEDVSRVGPRKAGGTIKVHSCRVCKDRLRGTNEKKEAATRGNGSCEQFEFTALGQSFTEAVLREGIKRHGKTAMQIIEPMMSGDAYEAYLLRSLTSERRIMEQGGTTMPESFWEEKKQKALRKAKAEQAEAQNALRPLPALARCVDQNS